MQFKQVDEDYFIYVEKNEKVISSLTNFCIEQGLKNAKISGIGAVKMTEIGIFYEKFQK